MINERLVNVLFTFSYGSENMAKVKKLGYRVTVIKEAELTSRMNLSDVEVLVCYDPFDKIDLEKMPELKWIQLVSKGLNHVPAEKVSKLGLKVTNNGNATSSPISEWIFMLLLSVFKKTNSFCLKQQKKIWETERDILEISGKTIGILGTGNIGVETAGKLKAFGAVTYGLNRNGRQVRNFDKSFSIDSLGLFLKDCDAIICTLPDTPSTVSLLDESAFSLMKRGATVINVSRGKVIDQEALISRLSSGYLRGAALDVFEYEPLPPSSPLWSLDNVIITPHNSFLSDQYSERVFNVIYKNLQRYLLKENLEYTADLNRGF